MYENSMEEIYKAQNGNQEAMSKLVKQNSGLVWSIVKRFNSRDYELEDLYQIGSLRFSKSNKKIWYKFRSKTIYICCTVYIRWNKKIY